MIEVNGREIWFLLCRGMRVTENFLKEPNLWPKNVIIEQLHPLEPIVELSLISRSIKKLTFVLIVDLASMFMMIYMLQVHKEVPDSAEKTNYRETFILASDFLCCKQTIMSPIIACFYKLSSNN